MVIRNGLVPPSAKIWVIQQGLCPDTLNILETPYGDDSLFTRLTCYGFLLCMQINFILLLLFMQHSPVGLAEFDVRKTLGRPHAGFLLH